MLLLFHLVQAPVAHTGLVSDRRRRRDLEIWLRHLTPAPVAGLGLQFVTVRVRPGPSAGPARPRLAPSVASHHDSGASLARPSSSSGPTVNKLDPSRSARLDRRTGESPARIMQRLRPEWRQSRRQKARAQSETLGYDQLSG